MIHILLAEDDASMRFYLARALREAGYVVDTVDRGTMALPLLKEHAYDLLLTDIVMPEMDGIELAQRCSEISCFTRIMFITGFAAVAVMAGEQRRERILTKPFHLKDLVQEIEAMFADRTATASL